MKAVQRADGRPDVAPFFRIALDLPPPFLLQTAQGWCGPAEMVTLQVEVADACRATACAAIDALIEARAIKAGRNATRAMAGQ